MHRKLHFKMRTTELKPIELSHRANLQHYFQESPLPAGQYQTCCNIPQAIQNQCFSIVLLGAILASFLVPLGAPVKAKEIFVAWLPQANIAAVSPFQVLFQNNGAL